MIDEHGRDRRTTRAATVHGPLQGLYPAPVFRAELVIVDTVHLGSGGNQGRHGIEGVGDCSADVGCVRGALGAICFITRPSQRDCRCPRVQRVDQSQSDSSGAWSCLMSCGWDLGSCAALVLRSSRRSEQGEGLEGRARGRVLSCLAWAVQRSRACQ
jgi:hypothetical protein